MATLDFVVAAFLDPVQAAIVLAVVLAHRGPRPVVVAGVVAGLVSETVRYVAADGYVWGTALAPHVVATLMQAAVLCRLVRLVQPARRSEASAGGGRALGNADATLASLGGAGPLPSPAGPWRMQTYVRHRINGLRLR
jgi:hypothetical protein